MNLGAVFARTEDVREGEPPLLEGNGGAELQVADPGNPVHAAARLPGVSVEEDVACNGAAVNAGKKIPAERRRGLEEIRARQARLDARRTVVVGQIEADAADRADIQVIVDRSHHAA